MRKKDVFDYKVFECYNEPVIIIDKSEKVEFLNNAAKTAFKIDFTGDQVRHVFVIPVVDHIPNNAWGTVAYKGKSYTASFYKMENCHVISILDTDIGQISKDEMTNSGLFNSICSTVRNSLNTQQSALSVVRPKIDELGDNKLINYIAAIDRACHKIKRTLNNVSALYNREIPAAMQVSCIDIVSICNALIQTLTYLMGNNGIATSLQCEEEHVIFFGDKEVIVRLILNLLSNSYKYTSNDEVIVSVRSIKNGVEIKVTDNGAGIPIDVIKAGFKQYERPYGIEDPKRGIGLGLYIAQRIAEMYNGGLIIESELGKGTTVTVSMYNAVHETIVKDTVIGYDTDMEVLLTELSDILDYKCYISRNQE